jgi:lipopolysaccharide export system protein LptA
MIKAFRLRHTCVIVRFGFILSLLSFPALLSSASIADAQTLDLASTNDAPIEVQADNGIEWQQDNEVLIARGNARAIRAGVTVFADVLRAYYHKDATSGGSNLKRLDGAGKVRILSQSETIEGDGAVYDMAQAILVVSGKKVTYRSGDDVITADQQMEYYENAQKAVARVNATALHDGKKIQAQTLEAYFHKTVDNKSEVYEVRAFDDVVIITETDVARADRAIYNVKTQLATLVGNVRITRGETQLDGDQAEVNMRTGISRLLTNNSRVRGIIVPQKREPAKKGAQAKSNTTKGAKK